MSFILGLFKKLPVFIYDFFISTFLTISAHLAMVSLMNFSGGNFLDIGCGTGAPLKQILPNLRSFTKIIGIDMHQ